MQILFGGADRRTLFILTHHALYSVTTRARARRGRGERDDCYNSDMPPRLTNRERAALKARAHALEPVVHVGSSGVTDAVVAEVDGALTAHELIKVKVGTDDRANRVAVGDRDLCPDRCCSGAPSREGHHPVAAASTESCGLGRGSVRASAPRGTETEHWRPGADATA